MFIYTHKAEPCLPIGWASSFDAGPLCGAPEVMAVAKEAGTKPAVNVMQRSLTLGGHGWEQTHILLLKTCKLPLCFGKVERTIRITFVSRWTTSEIKCIFLLLFYLRWKMQRKKHQQSLFTLWVVWDRTAGHPFPLPHLLASHILPSASHSLDSQQEPYISC